MSNKGYSKDVIMQAIARVSGGLLGFLSVIVLTYCFTEEEIGRYNLALSTLNISISLATLWISQSILRFYNENENKSFILLASFISLGVGLLITYVCSFFVEVTIWGYIFCLTLVLYNILDAIFRKTRSLLQYVLLELLFSAGRLFPMLLISYYFKRYDAVFISQSILLGLYIFILMLTNRKKRIHLEKVDFTLFKKYLKFGMPLMGLSVSQWFLSSSARYIIAFFEGEASVGIYSTVQSLAHSIYSMFTLIIVSAFHPVIVNQWDKERLKTVSLVSQVMDYHILFIVPLVFYGCLKAPIVLSVFKGETYSMHSSIFVWTAVAQGISGLSLLCHKYYELTQKTIWILVFNVISAGVNIVLNLIFVPVYGFGFSAVVAVISSMVYFLLVKITTHKKFPALCSWKTIGIVSASLIVFYFLDRMIVTSTSFLGFLIEGFIYVLYTIAIYVFTKTINIKSLLNNQQKKR